MNNNEAIIARIKGVPATKCDGDNSADPNAPQNGAVVFGWQPIETAPKDGRAIFVASRAQDVDHGEANGGVIHHPAKCYIAKWDPEGDSWTDEYGRFDGQICKLTVTGIWDCDGGWFQPNEVTHWMPLPDPPETNKMPGAVAPKPPTGELKMIKAKAEFLAEKTAE
jgi:hypothetical protein